MDLQCVVVFPSSREERLYRDAIRGAWISDLRHYYCGNKLKLLWIVGGADPLCCTDETETDTIRFRTEHMAALILMGIKHVLRQMDRTRTTRTRTARTAALALKQGKRKSTQMLVMPYNIYPNLYRILTGNVGKLNGLFVPYISRATNFTQKVLRDLMRGSMDGERQQLKNLNPESHHNMKELSEILYWTISDKGPIPKGPGSYLVLRQLFFYQYGDYLFDLLDNADPDYYSTPKDQIYVGSIMKKVKIVDFAGDGDSNDGMIVDRPVLLQSYSPINMGNKIGDGSISILLQEAVRGLPTGEYVPRYIRLVESEIKWVTDLQEASNFRIMSSLGSADNSSLRFRLV